MRSRLGQATAWRRGWPRSLLGEAIVSACDLIAAVAEPAAGIVGGDSGDSVGQFCLEGFDRSGGRGAQECFNLGPTGFDRRPVRAISRQISHRQARRVDRIPDRLTFMSRQIIQDEDRVWLVLAQERQQHRLEKIDKDRGGRSAGHRHEANPAVQAQRPQAGEPVPVHRRRAAGSLPDHGTGIASRHVGQDPRLVEEHQAGRVDQGDRPAIGVSCGGNIGSVLLTRPKRLFFRTKPCRCKARQIFEALIFSPVRAVKAAAYSASVASLFSATRARSTAPPSPSKTEAKPRPWGLGSRRPSWRSWRSSQLETVFSEIWKRRAMAAWLSAPASHASKTRSRKSVEYGRPMAISLPEPLVTLQPKKIGWYPSFSTLRPL